MDKLHRTIDLKKRHQQDSTYQKIKTRLRNNFPIKEWRETRVLIGFMPLVLFISSGYRLVTGQYTQLRRLAFFTPSMKIA
jgi:recombinational DNA repair ATPase RecF